MNRLSLAAGTGVLCVLQLTGASRAWSEEATPTAPALATAPVADYRLERAYPNLRTKRPLAVVAPPDGSGRLFAVLQRGMIFILPQNEESKTAPIFLDISARVESPQGAETEMGLLGMAFHPQFAQNGKFYVNYTREDMRRSIVSEFQVLKGDPKKADMASERILIEQPQPYPNHKSGNLLFGPDGYLYIPFGDGGKRDDATRTAQNLFSLLGKVLRIDVDRTQGSRPYGIPEDNPYPHTDGIRPEIWAMGVRNPWGISFDPDGNFWLADVGQDLWEEVNLVVKGGNYGWSHREGAHPFMLRTDAPPAELKFIDPIFEYAHSEGVSVTGGFVYRGEKLPKLKGAYLCGDWGLGRIWALWLDKKTHKLARSERIYTSPPDAGHGEMLKPTAICEGSDREVLVVDWNGPIYRLVEK